MRYLILVVAILTAGASAKTKPEYKAVNQSKDTIECLKEAKKRKTKKTFHTNGLVCKLKKAA